jgi:acylphosphatase
MTDIAYKLKIRGRVQGVSFTYYARRRAQSWGIRGWIRNARDGSVEALVQGDEEAVKQFIDWAHKGPSMADVTDVEVDPTDLDESLHGFGIG